MYVESGFKGVYTVSASFTLADSTISDPIVSINPEVWYGPVTLASGATYQNCAIVYVKLQLPIDSEGNCVYYDNMSLKFTLTRNQVWDEGRKKEYTFTIKRSDFDASGYYYAGLAIRRKDLDNADGVTADGYIMNVKFLYNNDGNDVNEAGAPRGVEFGLGKQSLTFSENEKNVIMFNDTPTTYVISDIMSTSGIHRESIKWTSSDTSVATVERVGNDVVVTVLKQGAEAIIKASAGDNNAKLLITSMGMSFNDGTKDIESVVLSNGGENITVSPTAINLGTYTVAGNYSYSVEDETVATVEPSIDGTTVTVTPQGVGVTYITVTVALSESKTLSVKLPVYVTDAGETNITANLTRVDIGSKVTFSVSTDTPSVIRWEWTVISGTEYLENGLTLRYNGTKAIATGKSVGTATVVAIGYNLSDEIVAVAVKDISVIRKE